MATPIGNLLDLSDRARQALSSADLIACEDTRRTSRLLAELGSAKSLARPLVRIDAHAAPREIDRMVERLSSGESIALVTDAGTPGISDPGARLVERAREEGVTITPVPGPSAVMALLSASGFTETAFTFRGFFPRKTQEQSAEIQRAADSETARVFVWFESPHRIESTLSLIAEAAPNAKITAVKELTKLHERFFAGNAGEVASQVKAEICAEGEIGEWCFAVAFPSRVARESEAGAEDYAGWTQALQCLGDAGVSASEAARIVSQRFGAPKKLIYSRALEIYAKKR